MSKTTDALDWAYDTGYRQGIARATVLDEPAVTDTAVPETPIATETFGAAVEAAVQKTADYADGHTRGFNEALAEARRQLWVNLDTLIATYQRAAEDDDLDVRIELFAVIDQRVSELKR